MQARRGQTILAEANESDLARIEGNWYFPASSVTEGVLVESPTPYTCAWKGECQYYNVMVGGEELVDGAWAYVSPYPSAIDRVGKDFSGFVTFSRDVEIVN